MLYLLYLRLAEHHHYVPILNLLKYLTFRTGMSVVTAQVIVVAMGLRFIRWMQAKQGKGQPIRTDGIERHVVEKAGTPTMGGLMIMAGLLGSALIWCDPDSIYVWAAMGITAGYGFLGFLDDYAKVTKQSTDGLSGTARLGLETAMAFCAVFAMVKFGGFAPGTQESADLGRFPDLFKALLLINLGWFYLAFGYFIIVGAANAVNFTDGLDGLGHRAGDDRRRRLRGDRLPRRQLRLLRISAGPLRPRRRASWLFAAIIVRPGFLWANAAGEDPRGDTALALGGALGAVAVACKHEIVLGIVGDELLLVRCR